MEISGQSPYCGKTNIEPNINAMIEQVKVLKNMTEPVTLEYCQEHPDFATSIYEAVYIAQLIDTLIFHKKHQTPIYRNKSDNDITYSIISQQRNVVAKHWYKSDREILYFLREWQEKAEQVLYMIQSQANFHTLKMNLPKTVRSSVTMWSTPSRTISINDRELKWYEIRASKGSIGHKMVSSFTLPTPDYNQTLDHPDYYDIDVMIDRMEALKKQEPITIKFCQDHPNFATFIYEAVHVADLVQRFIFNKRYLMPKYNYNSDEEIIQFLSDSQTQADKVIDMLRRRARPWYVTDLS